jgi:hypothetical protein
MRRLLILFFLIHGINKINAQSNFQIIKLYKVDVVFNNKETFSSILYEVKGNELIFVEDNPLLFFKINTIDKTINIDKLKFQTLYFEDEVKIIRIRKKNSFQKSINKGFLIGLAASVSYLLVKKSISDDIENDKLKDLSIIFSSSLFGTVGGMFLSVFPLKTLKKEKLIEGFPVEDLKKYSLKWQIEQYKFEIKSNGF